jgi:hypothetical protein
MYILKANTPQKFDFIQTSNDDEAGTAFCKVELPSGRRKSFTRVTLL